MQFDAADSVLSGITSCTSKWKFTPSGETAISASISPSVPPFERHVEEIRRAASVKLLQVWRQVRAGEDLSALVDVHSTWRRHLPTQPIVAKLHSSFCPFVIKESLDSLRLALLRLRIQCSVMSSNVIGPGRYEMKLRWGPELTMKVTPFMKGAYG